MKRKSFIPWKNQPSFEDRNMLFDRVVVLVVIEYYIPLLNERDLLARYSRISNKRRRRRKVILKKKKRIFHRTGGRSFSPLSSEGLAER